MFARWLVAAASIVLALQHSQTFAGDGPSGYVPDELTGIFRDQLQNQPQSWRDLLVQAYAAEEDTLRTALSSKSSTERLAAAYVVGERLLPWSGELIDRLTDTNPLVRQAARRSLIILSHCTLVDEATQRVLAGERPTVRRLIADFGPRPNADKAAQEKAAKDWDDWWQKHGARSKPKGTKVLLAGSEARLDTEAAKLSSALIFAPPDHQAETVARYRDEKGVAYTEALAEAVPQLQGALQRKAREALADRLARMTVTTLRDRLNDTRPEVRRAAVLARATKNDRDAVSDLIPSLADEDENVIRAAKAALKSLAGQDFGPPRNPTASERAAAVAAWKAWCQKQQSSP